MQGIKRKKIEFTHTFTDERVRVNIHLTKEDSETGKNAQGDATLEGAVYGLYAREAIGYPDGSSGVLYPKDAQVATLTTDKSWKCKCIRSLSWKILCKRD